MKFTCPIHGEVPRDKVTTIKSCGLCVEERNVSAADAPPLRREPEMLHDEPDVTELTIEEVVDAIDISTEDWEGNCYAIACAVVAAGLVEGHAVYGSWHGRVNPEGYWSEQADRLWQRHGWVLLPDDRILDPTRWSFEAVEPYLWIGENDGNYDEGNDALHTAIFDSRPCPEYDDDGEQYDWQLSTFAAMHLQVLSKGVLRHEDGLFQLCFNQVFWIANIPYGMLGPFAQEIYQKIIDMGRPALIPMDNRSRAFRD